MTKRTAMTVGGTVAAILSAVAYGANPLGVLNLYGAGYTPDTVILYRFAFAALALFVAIPVLRLPLLLPAREMGGTALVGAVYAISSITFYYAIEPLGAGLASTVVFTYPIFVTLLMCLFFGEKFSWRFLFAILLALAGVERLVDAGDTSVSFLGFSLAIFSAFTDAIYIVALRRLKMKSPLVPATFWTMLFAFLTSAVYVAVKGGAAFVWPRTWSAAGWGLFLGVCPSVVSLALLTYALKRIGATPAAIYGALEPPTAVLVGCVLFGEPFSARIAFGILLILASVTIVILKSAIRRRPGPTDGP